MAITVPPQQIIDDAPTILPPPAGGVFLSGYAWAEYFQMPAGAVAETFQIDFHTPTPISPDLVHTIMTRVRAELAAAGEVVLAYGLYRGLPTDIRVPDRICIAGVCIDTPFGGSTLFQIPMYRLWFVHRPAAAALVRGDVRALGPLMVVAIALGVIALLVFLVGVGAVLTGRIMWADLARELKKLYEAPGRAVAGVIRETSFPLMALGFVMVATSIALPFALTKARVGVKGGPVTGDIEISGGRR